MHNAPWESRHSLVCFPFESENLVYEVSGLDLFMQWVYPQRYTEAVQAICFNVFK